ncbi:unnamed protein product [Adineta ricciae]|uniref:Uncharacterized protein n=1 Tax=Adineta ricciae TaxID=249248 RepID=A0A815BRL6_ADIRI|nr:unnamed protein product [Adineta ricciae]CAF1497403.1 unnamed protein product [Adineta ricciae]
MLKLLSRNSIDANHRQRMQETWKRTKKLFKQFLPLTILYLVIQLPWALRQAFRSIFPGFMYGIPQMLEMCLAYLTVIYQLFIVFTIFFNQHELRSKFKEQMKRLWTKRWRLIVENNLIVPISGQTAAVQMAREHH